MERIHINKRKILTTKEINAILLKKGFMPKIPIADLDQFIEDDEEYVDRREVLREKQAKSRFKENAEDRHRNE